MFVPLRRSADGIVSRIVKRPPLGFAEAVALRLPRVSVAVTFALACRAIVPLITSRVPDRFALVSFSFGAERAVC